MVQKLDYLPQTPSQTAGPYVHIGLLPAVAGIENAPYAPVGQTIFDETAKGERITVTGSVIDGGGMTLRDVLIETWQADSEGRYPGQPGADPGVHGFGRCAVEPEAGLFRFDTIRPGPVALTGGRGAPPHITFWIVARGINTGLHTRMYFPEDDLSGDPLLARIEHRERIATLVAEKTDGGYRFDIRLQGPGETVFFDI